MEVIDFAKVKVSYYSLVYLREHVTRLYRTNPLENHHRLKSDEIKYLEDIYEVITQILLDLSRGDIEEKYLLGNISKDEYKTLLD